MVNAKMIYEARDHVLVIYLPRELDHHNCGFLKEETDLFMSETYIRKMVFDFSRTNFMDSSGIGVLLSRYKQMKSSGGSVTICGVNEQVHRILTISGIYKIITSYETKEQAIAG